MTQFEHYILSRRNLSTFLRPDVKLKVDERNGDSTPNEKSAPRSKLLRWFWWEPAPDSWLHDFFAFSAIHGLKYISKRKLSLLERLFWILAFIASFYAASVMIGEVWTKYHKSPVVVTFNPKEEETSSLPFPAVTICNKNLFSKSKVEELFSELESDSDKQREQAMEKLRLVNALCTSRQSFLRRMNLVKSEVFPNWDSINVPPSQESVDGIVKFIYEFTQPCSSLLRVCSWGQGQSQGNCSGLFRPLVTDYGKCCVFNKIPSDLMEFERDDIDGVEKRERGWSAKQIEEWRKWDYENGFTLSDEKYPYRQKRAGSLNGLSIVVDADVENGYCPSQDSQGVRILLHTSIDAPRISHMGTSFGVEREIFIKVFPDLTVAEKSILDFDYEIRKCIFGKTNQVGTSSIDKPYTRNNCFLTCNQRHIRQACNCTLHYARRKKGYRVCNPSIKSEDYRCSREVETRLGGNINRRCSPCIYGCNYLKYNIESTESQLLDASDLWGDNETAQPPAWAKNKLSILHIFMGSDMHVPKLREKLYGTVDLIASIGGLLGLSLGFSVLAAIEILYLLTLRIFCKRLRKR